MYAKWARRIPTVLPANLARKRPSHVFPIRRQKTTSSYFKPFKMSASIETIDGGKAWYKCAAGPMVLGEAPIYRASDSTLHWVDALKEPAELHILKVDPESGDAIGDARVLVLEDSVSVHFFRKDVKGSYICAYYSGVAFMDEQTGKLEVLKEIIPTSQRSERRFNDGGVDAKGRFWLAEIDKTVSAPHPCWHRYWLRFDIMKGGGVWSG
jgi:sugar lactone lactonase YvrE